MQCSIGMSIIAELKRSYARVKHNNGTMNMRIDDSESVRGTVGTRTWS
jgi:hypothetical protein